jgi:hypothetical protein
LEVDEIEEHREDDETINSVPYYEVQLKLEKLIQSSAHLELYQDIVNRFLVDNIHLIGVSDGLAYKVEPYTVYSALHSVLLWAVEHDCVDEEQLIEDIRITIVEPEVTPPQFLPQVQYRTSGVGHFLHAEMQCEGITSENDMWRLVEEV